MDYELKNSDSLQSLNGGVQHPRATSLDRAAEIAEEVQELVMAGRERSAWELIQHLHPADMGSIVASLPRSSKDIMISVMPYSRRT